MERDNLYTITDLFQDEVERVRRMKHLVGGENGVAYDARAGLLEHQRKALLMEVTTPAEMEYFGGNRP